MGATEINEGKGGRPSSALDEFRAVLENHRVEPEIDRFVVALGGNDARSPEPGIAAQVARNVGEMIDLVRSGATAWKIIVCGPCNINRAHLQNKAIADLREKNLLEIDSALQALADRKECPFVKFLGVIPHESLSVDGVHPGATGHVALAATFLASLPKTL